MVYPEPQILFECHETTARAARLEQGVLVTLKMIGFVVLLGVPVSRHGVA